MAPSGTVHRCLSANPSTNPEPEEATPMKKLLTSLLSAVVTIVIATATLASAQSSSLGSAQFTDIPEGHYADEAIGWAVENGITTGTSDTTFSPDATLTRAQMVTFLKRYDDKFVQEIEEVAEIATNETVGQWQFDSLRDGSGLILLESTRISSDVTPLPFPGIAHLGVSCLNTDLVWFVDWPIDVKLQKLVITPKGGQESQQVNALETSGGLMIFDSSYLHLLDSEYVLVGTKGQAGGAIIARFETAGLSQNLPLIECS